MFQNVIEFWSQHMILANSSHAAGGFGLALILQRYLAGEPFLPVWVGWLLLGYCLAAHVYAFTQ